VVVLKANMAAPRSLLRARTKIVQGWPKLRANFRALLGIFSQSVGPSLAIWANPVHFSLAEYSLRRTPNEMYRVARK
jgi:hypothetical protein